MEQKNQRSVDELISYLIQSKKELKDQIKKDLHKPEFQKAIADLKRRKTI